MPKLNPLIIANKLNKLSTLFVLLILTQQIFPIYSQLLGDEKTIEQFLDRLLHPKNYDRRIRPFFNSDKSISKPSVIKLNMNINTISQISEVNMVS